MTTALWLVITGALLLGEAPGESQDLLRYDDWFTSAAMRVDVFHSGDAIQEQISLDAILEEPVFAGSRTQLVDPLDYGKYRFLVRDADSRRLLYSRGFSTLFGEWQTVPEASSGLRRSFHETLRFPWPKQPVIVSVESRDERWVFQRVVEFQIDPSSHTILRERRYADFAVKEIEVNGPVNETVDLLFVGEGYTADAIQEGKLERDAQRFMEALFSWEPFKSRRASFSVRIVESISRQRGMDEPRKGIFRDTLLGFTFNTFDIARYLNSTDNRVLRDVAGSAPYDALIVLVNASRYGGAGIYNFYAVIVSDNEYDDYVAVHEFGHSFAGLADEYYTSSVAYSDFYPVGIEPWEPNITALADVSHPKWEALLTTGVAIPSDVESAGDDTVGVFEGAGYAAKGLYRPQKDCKMFSKGAVPFCAVCQGAIERMIDASIDPRPASTTPASTKGAESARAVGRGADGPRDSTRPGTGMNAGGSDEVIRR